MWKIVKLNKIVDGNVKIPEIPENFGEFFE
jgi:hypothetical protein